ncbi:spherulation-specific family 4 protein [Streptomyces sp. NPDC050161]|uniref:spherulation-specific family 4 protein n=1 Tax=Streptomyces sp. NPDC050161 TaxID=3365604 RepID=UPI00378CAE69
MPHLTTVDTARAPTGAAPLGVGVPGIAHPLIAPTEWAGLLRISRGFVPSRDTRFGHAGVAPLHWAVLNVSNGPGARPDPHCLPVAARLRETGVRLLGHLDMRDGARPLGELLADAHRYLEWYKTDGFWLDRCPTDRTMLPESRRVTTALRTLVDHSYVVFGHGAQPFPGYAESADQLVTFAGPWAEYRWSQAAEWTADHPPERFCHLVHGVPRSHLDEALRIARWQGAGTVYFTDRRDRGGDAWETLPGYWDDFVSRIGPGVLE